MSNDNSLTTVKRLFDDPDFTIETLSFDQDIVPIADGTILLDFSETPIDGADHAAQFVNLIVLNQALGDDELQRRQDEQGHVKIDGERIALSVNIPLPEQGEALFGADDGIDVDSALQVRRP